MTRRRNPNQTLPLRLRDEAQTATLIMTEGSLTCFTTSVPYKAKRYRFRYPAIYIKMCDQEALEPAARVFGVRVLSTRTKQPVCSPELFPPDGRGIYQVRTVGQKADSIMRTLSPLLSTHARRKWETVKNKCR